MHLSFFHPLGKDIGHEYPELPCKVTSDNRPNAQVNPAIWRQGKLDHNTANEPGRNGTCSTLRIVYASPGLEIIQLRN